MYADYHVARHRDDIACAKLSVTAIVKSLERKQAEQSRELLRQQKVALVLHVKNAAQERCEYIVCSFCHKYVARTNYHDKRTCPERERLLEGDRFCATPPHAVVRCAAPRRAAPRHTPRRGALRRATPRRTAPRHAAPRESIIFGLEQCTMRCSSNCRAGIDKCCAWRLAASAQQMKHFWRHGNGSGTRCLCMAPQ